MKIARMILEKLMYPPKWILIVVPVIGFAMQIFIFAANKTESVFAYPIYCISAYSLFILVVAVVKWRKKIKLAVLSSNPVQKAVSSKIGSRYINDIAFRACVSICQGMIANFFYAFFYIIVGIRYVSVWFISIAVYYLVLGTMRAYLFLSYRRRSIEKEYRCYRKIAWLLFLLNIPMGGMIVLMIWRNSGFSSPGYLIYLSAIYTFYTLITSIINLIKFRKLGSPILSAAKVLSFVAAAMSILGLQTAMISQFSANGEDFRRLMNAVTGGAVYVIVVLIAVYMLLHSPKSRKKVNSGE